MPLLVSRSNHKRRKQTFQNERQRGCFAGRNISLKATRSLEIGSAPLECSLFFP